MLRSCQEQVHGFEEARSVTTYLCAGVNTGIMLVRNVEESKVFWEDVAYVSRININAVRGNDTEAGRIKVGTDGIKLLRTEFEK